MDRVPRFPLIQPIEQWDELTLLAANVFCEAEGEPDEGKVAVAWVVRVRADRRKKSVHEVILQPYQFSWLNMDYRLKAEARLAAANVDTAERCWRAAAGALWRFLPDPTDGSDHYLNVELTKKIRPKHDLPEWFDTQKIVAVIGNHTFLKLET